MYIIYTVREVQISIQALREEGDVVEHANAQHITISIHALREEGDSYAGFLVPGQIDFYPRPPRGGRRYSLLYTSIEGGISIHALREEGDMGVPAKSIKLPISIHALREEGDGRKMPKKLGSA